jgi:uncharacterized protein (TIGR03435 family)
MVLAQVTVGATGRVQTMSTESRPAFEVASIKRSAPGPKVFSWGEQPGGRWSMANSTIETLIRAAYDAQVYDLDNVPSWVRSDRYEVRAKSDANPSREQMRLMLQSLLSERFAFSARFETQDRPVLALVNVRKDGRLSPALRPSRIDCEKVNAARREGRAPGVAPPDGFPLCGWSTNGAEFRVGGLPLSRLPGILGPQAGAVIVDRTDVDGTFDFLLKYTNQLDATDSPSLSTALEDQLGLKLVSARAPLQVLVVDRISRPTED